MLCRVMGISCVPVAAGRAALVHKRFALSRFAATKALLRREMTLMKRNAIVYAYRLCQVTPVTSHRRQIHFFHRHGELHPAVLAQAGDSAASRPAGRSHAQISCVSSQACRQQAMSGAPAGGNRGVCLQHRLFEDRAAPQRAERRDKIPLRPLLHHLLSECVCMVGTWQDN